MDRVSQRIWALFDAEEQRSLIAAAVSMLRQRRNGADAFERTIAKRLRWQPRTVRLALPEDIARRIAPLAPTTFRVYEWNMVWLCSTPEIETAVHSRFMNLLGVDQGGAESFEKRLAGVDADQVEKAYEKLVREFDAREVARCVGVMSRVHDEDVPWLHGLAVRALALSDVEASWKARNLPDVPVESPADARASSDEFTTLDRLLLDTIVATANDVEGALPSDDLVDLVDTVVHLNSKRKRSFFHRGFMDGVVPGRVFSFVGQELDSARREWYLAGAVAALARRGDQGRLRAVLTERADDFRHAAAAPGQAGASMAKTAFDVLCDMGAATEAVALLKGQLKQIGEPLARRALKQSTALVISNKEDVAEPLLEALLSWLESDPLPDLDELNPSEVRRRYAQCLQARGDFAEAERQYASLDVDSDDASIPVDRALVLGGFKRLWDIGLHHDEDRRQSLAQSLDRGAAHLRRAVEIFGADATNAHYLLGLRSYLAYTLERRPEPKAQARLATVDHLEQATSAMRRSELANAYETTGVLELALFMLATARMDSADPAEARSAMAAWGQITTHVHQFPERDLRTLLDAAELIDPRYSAAIAEYVWEHRRPGAWSVLSGLGLIDRSTVIRARFVDAAKDENLPREKRFDFAREVVDSACRTGDRNLAEQAFDLIEDLAVDGGVAERMLAWMAASAGLDVVANEHERLWLRIELLRRLGRDDDATECLKILYYRARDGEEWQRLQVAEYVVTHEVPLSTFNDPSAKTVLRLGSPKPVARSAVNGAQISVVFVGGNETQEQYQDAIAERLARNWPGVRVQYFHTGWSSNFGSAIDDVLNAADHADVVVMMTFMRTMMGRAIRRKLTKPWVSCSAHGRDGMIRAIEEGARVVLEMRTRATRPS